MKLIVNYKGINKVMLSAENYSDLVKFVHQNFFLRMSKWNMHYIDSDGDSIFLESEADFTTMLDTEDKDQVKVFLKDADLLASAHELEQVGAQAQIVKVEVKEQQKGPWEEHKKVEEKKEEKKEEKEVEVEVEKEVEVEVEKEVEIPKEGDRCGGRQMWKKKIEEKMAKFVEERIQVLLPYITKQVEENLSKREQEAKLGKIEKMQESKQEKKDDAVIHKNVKCNGCGAFEIIGIRYKCLTCPVFNFCQKCESTNPHPHNLLKMKIIEQEQPQFGPFSFGNPHAYPRSRVSPCNPNLLPPPPLPPFAGPQWPNFPPPPPPPPLPWMQPGMFTGFNQEKQEKQKDERVKLTKKCFRFTETFGGHINDHEGFITKNMDLSFEELVKLHISMNPTAKIQELTKQKVTNKISKLGFYFRLSPETYRALVVENPSLNFQELVELAKTKNLPEIKSVPEPKEDDLDQKPKCQQVQVQVKKMLEPQIPPMMIPVQKPPTVKVGSLAPQAIKKRNQCVLEMKELFGDEKVFEYIIFYQKHQHEENSVVIQKYLESLEKEKDFDQPYFNK